MITLRRERPVMGSDVRATRRKAHAHTKQALAVAETVQQQQQQQQQQAAASSSTGVNRTEKRRGNGEEKRRGNGEEKGEKGEM